MKMINNISRHGYASLRELTKSVITCRFESNRWSFFITPSLIIVAIFACDVNGFSQTSLETLIENTRKNNKTLNSAQQYYEAEVIEARTGNSPDNPEIEYSYLWGSPDQLGDRVDFAVTQSFDFPTAYSSRSKLSRIKQEQANYRLKASEQDVIVKAHQVWVTAVYLNQKIHLVNHRLENARLIANAFQRMYDEGEANQLQLNQAKLKVTALTNELKRIEIDIIKNNASIRQINGGNDYLISDSSFPTPKNFVMDTLINLYRIGPQNLAYQGEVIRMERQKDVIFNQKLPKLKAGYYQETIMGTQLKGITAGITIPLWENANAVKSAKAGVVFAENDALRFWEQKEIKIKQLYDQWLMLKAQVNEMTELLKNANNNDLLLKALDGGEISLTQYYYESDFYFQNQFDLLDLERDLHLVEAELLRVSY